MFLVREVEIKVAKSPNPILGTLSTPLNNIDGLETSQKTPTLKSHTTTAVSPTSKPPSILLNSVKSEVSYDTLKEGSFHNSPSPISKGLKEKSSFVTSGNYPTSSNNSLTQDKNSENLENKAMKNRAYNAVTSGKTTSCNFN